MSDEKSEPQKRFRILSLDGGGIRGVYAAAFLDEIERLAESEKLPNRRIRDCFDLMTGTSTGGLLAIGLALEFPPSKLLGFYREHGREIFPCGFFRRKWRFARHFLKPKHDAKRLRSRLSELFGDKCLGDAKVNLVIPSFDVDHGKTVCFKTRHHERLIRDHTLKAWEVAMATCGAPTYFPAFESSWKTCYVDGGVWANSPTMVGIIEALVFLNIPLEQMAMLSVGTTGAPFALGGRRQFVVFPSPRRAGIIPYAMKGQLVELFMEANGSAAQFQASLLLRDRFVGINELTLPGRFSLDDSRWMDELEGLGRERAKAAFPQFCNLVGPQ